MLVMAGRCCVPLLHLSPDYLDVGWTCLAECDSHLHLIITLAHVFQSNAGVRRFTKPLESLERSLEMSRQRGRKKTQKRPNYKNVGEEEEEDRGAEEGPEEEKAKGTEASSKASRTSGDTEGEWQRMNVPPSLTNAPLFRAPPAAVGPLCELAVWA